VDEADSRLRDWPREWPPERVRAIAGGRHAKYVDGPPEARLMLLEGSEPIQVRTVIELDGVFLVEAAGEPDDWYMGARSRDGVIDCWGKYGDLESAIRSI
jgi:hypothetical protein